MISRALHSLFYKYPFVDQREKELLAAHILKKERSFIIAHRDLVLSKTQHEKINSALHRRNQGEPLAYIQGHKEFFGRSFFVTAETLIPRSETEILVEKTIPLITQNTLVWDIGTGSGAIITSLACENTSASSQNTFLASDISPKALAIAQKNAKYHGVSEKITFLQGSLLSDILLSTAHSTPSFQHLILVTNLPYVQQSHYTHAENNTLTRGILFEPEIALVSGGDGLDHYRKLFAEIDDFSSSLPKNIHVLCEFSGDTKQQYFFKNISFSSYTITSFALHPDLSGMPRVASYQLIYRT
jgi:release factor glutamine methyltransferase